MTKFRPWPLLVLPAALLAPLACSDETGKGSPVLRAEECGEAPRCRALDESCSNDSDPGNLFECGATPSCPEVCTHLGTGDCSSDDSVSCGSELARAGAPGLMVFESRPGPGGFESDWLVAFLGDGRALKQVRERSCPPSDTTCSLASLDWKLNPQELCEVSVQSGCDADDPVCSFPSLRNCVPLGSALACDSLQDVLDGNPPDLDPRPECQQPAQPPEECEDSLQIAVKADSWPVAEYELLVEREQRKMSCSFELAGPSSGAAGAPSVSNSSFVLGLQCRNVEGGLGEDDIPLLRLDGDRLSLGFVGTPNELTITLSRDDTVLLQETVSTPRGCHGARVEFEAQEP